MLFSASLTMTMTTLTEDVSDSSQSSGTLGMSEGGMVSYAQATWFQDHNFFM